MYPGEASRIRAASFRYIENCSDSNFTHAIDVPTEFRCRPGPCGRAASLNLSLHLILGIPVGIVMANGIEWLVHKNIHQRGRQRGKFWSFHLHAHHVATRARGFVDPNCGPRPRMILWACAVLVPFAFLSPGICIGLILGTIAYWYTHHRAHRDPAWAIKWMPWHVEHHMSPNEEENWCITFPLFDWIMGTRVKYIGTPREAELLDIQGWSKSV